MGERKKIEKLIEGHERAIKEHKEKLEEYIRNGGKDYALIEYWKKEIKNIENRRNEFIEKLEKK
ncbi:MAG: hypothetical protein WD876_03955 [Candidatus Pacearchaeota archaeon]